ncbi:adenine deaminase [Neobacillus mesonae]|uniref:Adenine deaminase n=1 Tax=Neobacillus mesonae TaxID=1193713 RepID=A0A3Q9QWU4_9BACI|nr:adenine deaminase [Neobacillus mesonae]AZU62105.1 adenine deaminase [Neobacillus mesonae]
MNREKFKRKISAAGMHSPAELVIKNAKIIDVFNQEIMEADIAVEGGVIVGIGEYEGKNVIDAGGKYLAPGFIDGHVHIESAMVTPPEFAKVVLPHGVTTIIADPHEIANVSGLDGIKFMLDSSENLPLHVYFMLPSCVPATPFENAGAALSAKDLAPFYSHGRVLGLGEVMDYPSVFQGAEPLLEKLEMTENAGKKIDGHAAGIDSTGINVYMTAGIRTDHECVTAAEARERLERGMYVMLREGSAAKDLGNLLDAVTEKNARRCLFVTDDKHLDDIMAEGSIDHNVRLTISKGFDPILAIQMATLNAAECFGLKNKGAIAPGYDADFILLNHLEKLEIDQVFARGVLVAEKGKYLFGGDLGVQIPPPAKLLETVKFHPPSLDDLAIALDDRPMANVIQIIPNSIVTKHIVESVSKKDGKFVPSTETDLLKLLVIERHKMTGNIGRGIVKGFGLLSGAIASTVAHDSHNLVAVGTNDADLLTAIDVLGEMGGGMAVIQDGAILASLPLKISGLIANMGYEEINAKLDSLNQALAEIGFNGNFNPFLTMSFLALPVIPEIKVTDIGLFDVKNFRHIDVSVK